MRNQPGHAVDAFAALTMTRAVGDLRAFTCSFGANSVLPTHAHESATLFIVIDGNLTERVGRRSHSCEPGSVLLKAPSYEHSDVIGTRGLHVVGIEFCSAEPYRRGGAFPADVLWHARSSAILALGHRIRDELAVGDAASDLSLEAATLDVLALRMRVTQRRERREPRWLRELVARLHDSPANTLPSLSDVARETGLHAVYIARAFRAHMGCSLGTYVRRIRLDVAATCLRRSNDSIAAVAHAAGFADQSHFARAFRERFDCRPSEYRE
jgi:AraC family transcriptional regulator